MIIKMRIDDRLLHGQIAYSWRGELNYEAIVIASDEAANDEIRKAAMKMSTPDGVRLAIRSVEEAAKLVMNPKLEKMKVFLIVANPKDAYRLYEIIKERPSLNVGGMAKAEGKVSFSPAVFTSKEDLSYLDKIEAMGIEIEVRQVPSETVKKYQTLRKKISD
ncbi:PTS sugar transporter subunit IIB [Proteiniclasticum sp. SCR006]|uniref:PTS sugar transporter subunit IIB n=1 Tax=Proteiniclasticum aestuarii TaxID=2817862 RepID=A0A939H734_9CLOT|nr:PTS sugar transporter subunit IIB [Proteiniclasticum aestuarii]MBO1265404.1 PTS sugar transporter subunit IIB [Proteiniclasticum aestuarii]